MNLNNGDIFNKTSTSKSLLLLKNGIDKLLASPTHKHNVSLEYNKAGHYQTLEPKKKKNPPVLIPRNMDNTIHMLSLPISVWAM